MLCGYRFINKYYFSVPHLFLNSWFHLDIVIQHASDSRSAVVRAAALDAATTLLDAKQSHGVLRALLPSLGNLIHDKTEKVRLAAVKMLIKVKQVPGIRFYHIVPVDQLCARFVTEAKLHSSPRNAMSKELTGLMLNSYFPQGNSMSANQQLQRTLTFLLTDPNAASVFYANLAHHLEVESVVKFILMLFTCLKSSVDSDQANQVKLSQRQKKRRRRVSEDDSTDDHDDKDPSGNLSAANTPLMASIAETINALWDSIVISIEKPKNLACKKVLEERFADKDALVDIMAHFEQKGLESLTQQKDDESRRNECFRTCSSLLNCAARLDQKSTKNVVSFVTSSLTSVAKEESESVIPLVTSYFAFLCASKFVEDVAESMARSIELNPVEDVSLFSPDFEDTLGIRRIRRSSSSGSGKRKEDHIPTLPNAISWGVLEYILQGVSQEGRAMRQMILSSKTATRSIEKALEKGIKFAERLLADSLGRNFGNEEVEYVIRASEAYGRFALHKESSAALENDDKTSMDRQVGKLLLWTTNKIIPAFLNFEDDGASTLRDCNLSHISALESSLVYAEPGSPSIASPPKQKANRGRTPEAMRGPSSLFVTSPSDSPVIISAKVASALLLSSCMISSEMLAMGMSSADDISKAAVGWSQIFDQPERTVEKHLLCAFIRLGFQLYMASGDSTLLGDILVKCSSRFKENEAVTDVITKVFVSLLRMRNGTDGLLSIFFTVTGRIIQMGNISISFENASCSSEVWNQGGTIEILLDTILGNAGATLYFAEALVRKLAAANEGEGETNALVNFEAKCLSLIIQVTQGPEMTAILGDLDAQNFKEDGGMRLLVENLLECSA
jgi:condensin-2 complex subunit G2